MIVQLLQVATWCQQNKIGLVIVGPEAPLVSGIVDMLQAKGIRSGYAEGAAVHSLAADAETA